MTWVKIQTSSWGPPNLLISGSFGTKQLEYEADKSLLLNADTKNAWSSTSTLCHDKELKHGDSFIFTMEYQIVPNNSNLFAYGIYKWQCIMLLKYPVLYMQNKLLEY